MNDEFLIELVRQQPVLYHLKDKNYMNVELKGRIWQEIGNKMKVDAIQCKARWNNIRDNFRKSLGKRRTQSGQAAKKTKPYRFESQLQFLLEFMEERETKGNIGLRPDTDDGEHNDDNEREENLQTTIVFSPETFSQPAGLISYHSVMPLNPPIRGHIGTLDDVRRRLSSSGPAHRGPPRPSSPAENAATSNDTPSTSAAAFVKPTRVTGGGTNTQVKTAFAKLMKYVLDKKEVKGSPTVRLDNPIDCFLFGISSSLKSFSPYMQHLAKSEIFSTVQKFELQALQSQRTDCPRAQASQRTSYPNAASSQLEPVVDDNSSSQDTEREYWTNIEAEREPEKNCNFNVTKKEKSPDASRYDSDSSHEEDIEKLRVSHCDMISNEEPGSPNSITYINIKIEPPDSPSQDNNKQSTPNNNI